MLDSTPCVGQSAVSAERGIRGEPLSTFFLATRRRAGRAVVWGAISRLGGRLRRERFIATLRILSRGAADGSTEVVARTPEGGIHRTTYGEVHSRAKKLAKALQMLGVRPGDRVGSLAWNTHHHFELFYGVSGFGAVLHTINPRLFDEQLTYIVNHAEDEVIFVDRSLLALLWPLVHTFETVRHFVVMDDLELALND